MTKIGIGYRQVMSVETESCKTVGKKMVSYYVSHNALNSPHELNPYPNRRSHFHSSISFSYALYYCVYSDDLTSSPI